MEASLLAFAAAAGLVAALNPCGFAMLPAYLALVVLGEDTTSGGRRRATVVVRALVATALMALGFLVVFGAFGLVVAPIASSVQRFLPVVTVVVGAVMIGLGAWLLTGRELTVLLPRASGGAPTGRLGSMLGYGVAYAVASLSCTIGPFLAVTTATFGSGSVLGGVLAYLVYGLAMAVVVGVLAVAVALAGHGAATRFRRLLPSVNRASGGLLLLVGLYVAYYGVYELRLFIGGGSATDPVVAAAGAVQQTLSGWVDSVGLLPFAAVLLLLVVGGVLVRRRHRTAPDHADPRTERAGDTNTAGTTPADPRGPSR
ncbi:cytochrome c biogenesis protein CcdA [Actinomycetospora lutea]|uniref:cytochrome c biogenesis CcdA family protein n=1 Tax=Actinomycetospora lutea TaxID=663604 RepID=UPI002365095F|nr:cytochrome c biogenesis protein CcdA [Actinomycetospora lutea]MDD7941033.1 cytochrome c biogenesis protein CcdA [Actinomycetospora lutea]